MPLARHFGETTIAAKFTAPRANRPAVNRELIRPNDHRPTIPLHLRIRPDTRIEIDVRALRLRHVATALVIAADAHAAAA